MYGNIYVFDFDCTLTLRHFSYLVNNNQQFLSMYPEINYKISTYPKYAENFYKMVDILYNINGNPNTVPDDIKTMIIDVIFGDMNRFNKLKNFIAKLKQENTIIISSRGIVEQINYLLEIIKFNNFDMVYGNKYHKTSVLSYYLNNMLNTYNYLFYVDDNSEEHFEFIKTNKLCPPHIYDNFLMYALPNKCERYIFYNRLTLNCNGLNDTDMDNIINYSNNNQPITPRTVHQTGPVNYGNDTVQDNKTYKSTVPVTTPAVPAPAVPAPAVPALEDTDEEREPFGDDDPKIILSGGYYNAYEKNKNVYNKLNKLKKI